MTIASNTSNTSQAVPIGFTIVTDEWGYPGRTGLILDRRNAGWLAKLLAVEIYPKTVKPYASDETGIKWLAESIEFDLHVILNQMNVAHLYCENCGDTEQRHAWVGGYCPDITKIKPGGTNKFEERK